MQKFFTFPIDPETKEALRALAEAQDRSKAAVLRQLVKDAAQKDGTKAAPQFEKAATHVTA